MWYSLDPTIMSANGTVTYINCGPAHFPKDAASKEWLDRAQAKNEYPVIVYREAVALALTGVTAKAITDAKLKPETLDVAPPLTGTKDVKDAAVAVKLGTVVPVAEWTKVEALVAAKPVDPELVAGEDIGVGKLP